jgi:hypothetical protein
VGNAQGPKKQDGVIDLVDISVTEPEAVLAEPGVDTHVLSEIVPDRPVFDIAVHNNGDRTAFARRMHLQLKERSTFPRSTRLRSSSQSTPSPTLCR